MIAHVARLDALKDHITAIRAFRLIRDKLPQARLLVVGDGAERQAIESQIAESKLQGAVILAGLRRDVPRLLSACDIVWLTSLSEGIPLTLIEGMAAGLPVVATRVGGVVEVVEDNVTGLLAPAGNSKAIAAAALRLATDGSLRRRLALAGRRRAQDLFSEERMIAAYAHLFQELVHG
jgi:glycosyltransferase involved in cell wall biosynthesis